MKLNSTAKYQTMRDELAQAIRSGKFGFGEKLPSERELARNYDVSHMTARQAVTELVDAELVERRPRSGIYVRSQAATSPVSGNINLIAEAYDAAQIREFLSQATRKANEEGWNSQVILLGPGQQMPGVNAIRRGDNTIVMTAEENQDGPLREAMRNANGNVVAIQWYNPPAGVPSVLYDERRTIELAVKELQNLGHVDIAVVAQMPLFPISSIQVATWREAMSKDFSDGDLDARLIAVKVPHFDCPSKEAYAAAKSFLENPEISTTAMICLGDEITQGVLAACRDSGRPVPEHISLISIGDAPLLTFTDPAITAVDMNFTRQVTLAYEILKQMEANAGVWDGEALIKVRPSLVSRRSVQSPLVCRSK